jgi:uncharacterized repeat protein (TIGR01451 family)
LNDSIPDTQIDPSTGQVISAPATGPSALLDKWTVTKPEVSYSVFAKLSAPGKVKPGQTLTYTVTVKNSAEYALNGTQVHFQLPRAVTFAGTQSDTVTVQGNEVVITVGRIAVGSEQTVEIPALVSSEAHRNERIQASAGVSSSTALPVNTNTATTNVNR